MLLAPRTYSLFQAPDKGKDRASSSYFVCGTSLQEESQAIHEAGRMLLLHQAGSVKVGEVVRYTLTYTPSADRILPSPSHLHVKIKNTSSAALRAAYLHGPYTIHVSAYPSTFDPHRKVENPAREGVPEFEPNLKAGGSWSAKLKVPDDIRETGGAANKNWGPDNEPKSATWIIEIASQILFSNSASVSFELLVARDERSLDLGFLAVTGNTQGAPGQVKDHSHARRTSQGKNPPPIKGLYSKAVKLVVEDTQTLWNKPPLPEWEPETAEATRQSGDGSPRESKEQPPPRKRKKVHLVVLTHGLHSNLGADMLYMKESIDAAAKHAREESMKRKASSSTSRATATPESGENKGKTSSDDPSDYSTAPLSGGQSNLDRHNSPREGDEDDDDDELVIVRGFPGNAVRTERGIQYLGKRLAKYVLATTYPDQPFLPIKKSMSQKISNTFTPSNSKAPANEAPPAHAGSSIHHPPVKRDDRAYTYTSISFIGHSLGGLVQMYAIAYIQKHSPKFFELIQPINFVAMASPLLGLSNENPVYVKMALEIGLVGRTGQDLGLTWTTPTVVRSGWSAMLSGLGQKEQKHEDPRAKPLLRILPTGPAHQVLRRFRNRTVYSNVVNDGIVPLRTSCLLFLDWRGLGRVEKARRENGLIGTVAEWGWSNLTGQNTSPNPSRANVQEQQSPPPARTGFDSPPYSVDESAVPQPGADVTNEDDTVQTRNAATSNEPASHQFLTSQRQEPGSSSTTSQSKIASPLLQSANTLSKFLSFLQPSGAHTARDTKMFKRSQTVVYGDSASPAEQSNSNEPDPSDSPPSKQSKRPKATRGDSIVDDPTNVLAPPKTTIFESAGDLLNPPVPPLEWIINPESRARTIFHDRVYHPEDIPPPPTKKNTRFGRSFSSQDSGSTIRTEDGTTEESSGGMKVEEKIARAYHKDLSWRKVLVRLEPDAHNNIIVRRMFANAYGWPVVKHLCDTHFADTYAARTRDELESGVERAKAMSEGVSKNGEEVHGQHAHNPPKRTASEMREVADELAPLKADASSGSPPDPKPKISRQDSNLWDDSYFEGTSDSENSDVDDRGPLQRILGQPVKSKKSISASAPTSPTSPSAERAGTSQQEIADFLSASPAAMQGHRGLAPRPSSVSAPRRKSQADADTTQSPNGEPTGADGPRPRSLNTSELGLRKSIDQVMHSPAMEHGDRAGHDNDGVGSQVAKPNASSGADVT